MAMRLVVKEIGIDGRTFWVRPVGSWELDTGNRHRGGRRVSGLSSEAARMGRGGFFGNVQLSLELWAVIAGIPGFDD